MVFTHEYLVSMFNNLFIRVENLYCTALNQKQYTTQT